MREVSAGALVELFGLPGKVALVTGGGSGLGYAFASVLGQSFTPAALAAVSGRREDEVRPLLDGLVVKQILEYDDDPVSQERGQYAFLQAILRTVAYGTLARRTRKTLHLAAARQLRDTWPGEINDIVEVLADHYLEAIRADTQLLYASDWPHWDFDVPAKVFDLPFLDERARRNILGLNAARVFNLPVPERYRQQVAAE